MSSFQGSHINRWLGSSVWGTEVTSLGSLVSLLWVQKETISVETIVLSVVSKRLRTQWEKPTHHIVN